MKQLIQRIRENSLLAAILGIGTILITLSNVTDAAKKLTALFPSGNRAEINGPWEAEVIYDWKRTPTREGFLFDGNGEDIIGSVTFLEIPRGLRGGSSRKRNSFSPPKGTR